MNDMDRFSLVNDVIDRVPQLASKAAYAKQALRDKLPNTSNTSPNTATTCRTSLVEVESARPVGKGRTSTEGNNE